MRYAIRNTQYAYLRSYASQVVTSRCANQSLEGISSLQLRGSNLGNIDMSCVRQGLASEEVRWQTARPWVGAPLLPVMPPLAGAPIYRLKMCCRAHNAPYS
jgi:hypothetical protein